MSYPLNILVMIPTYNEAGNIRQVIKEVHEVCPNVEVLVVDDDSPDRTWEIVQNISFLDQRVHILRRINDRGRGFSGRDGFIWALDHGFDLVVEMDGDGSHSAQYLPAMLKSSAKYDVVIGSRFLPEGGSLRQGIIRDMISSLARRYIQIILGVKVSDPTSGFRLFRSSALRAINPSSISARDPFIVSEVLFRCKQAGLRIGEIAFVFRDRREGESKLGCGVLFTYLFRLLKLRLAG